MIGKIIELSAKNRVLVVLLTLAAAVLGWWSLSRTPVDAIPDLSDPQVIVYTEWMGRSPTLVEDQVTYPIVSQLLSAPHVTDVRGFSMFGMSFVYVIFEEGTDLYWARARVLEYLSTIQRSLPEDATPTLGPDATGIGWVFEYALVDRSGTHDLADLRTFQDFSLRYALASVPGVAEVASVGGYQKQYQVTVHPERLRAYGVTLNEVVAAIRGSNNDVGGRIVEMSQREYYVRGRGYIDDLGDLESVAIRSTPSGVPVLVRDVASVAFGPDIRRGLAELNGEGEVVGGIVVMRHGENAREVIERVKAKIHEAEKSFPPGVELVTTYDRSALIERSAETLRDSLLEEMIVVSLVIAIFLLHVRSTLVAVLTIPIGVLIAFVPMHALGMSSNIMSLGGIAIAIGAMVDAAIVMVENAHKKLEKAPPGADRGAILIEAAKETGPAIFFALLIITVAFLPIFTLPGQAGRLFKPLAFTKTFVMAGSAILSITLIPALMELFIRGKIFHEKNHPISRFIIGGYKPFVYVALRNPKTTVAIGLAAVISAVPLLPKLGSEFMPPLNEGDILYMPTTFPNISIEEAKLQLQAQDAVLRSFPEVKTVFGKIGRAESPTDPAPITMVETIIQLHPKEKWRKGVTWESLVEEMNKAMQIPGWTNAWTMPIKTRIDMLTTGVRTPVGVKLFGDDLDEIERMGRELETVLLAVPGTRTVYYERNLGGLYIDIVPDRDALARYGLTVADVQDVIEVALGGMPITTTIEGRKRFTVNVRYPRDVRSSVERLREVLVPVGTGGSGMNMRSRTLLDTPRLDAPRRVLFAQMDMGGSGSRTSQPGERPGVRTDAGGMASDAMGSGMTRMGSGDDATGGGTPRVDGQPSTSRLQIPLGQLADIRVTSGPPMVRDEDGSLVGYVFVDVHTATRDIGGYVKDAKAAVESARKEGRFLVPSGYPPPKWTGQYELLEEMVSRMKVVVPLTFALVVLLLWLQFRDAIEVLIVLLSIPFALVGSVWLMYLLEYRLSTAVWVGIIALVGLASQTGIVMIVYIDQAYERRKKAGMIRDLDDIIWAHMEGTVLRVRPKLMTVATMLIGLVPLLWATGSGADVMKRIAAPMVGGLLTSAFLTLEIIPVIYTYWRHEQLLWERLGERMDNVLSILRALSWAIAATAFLSIASFVTRILFGWESTAFAALELLLAMAFATAVAVYWFQRRHAAAALTEAGVRW